MAPISLIVVGAGSRGNAYAAYARQHPDELRVVGVAEPRAYQRESFARLHGLSPERCWSDWRPLLGRPRLADGVIIATQDHQHVEPAVALATHGYHLLLEKPMAPTVEECLRVVDAVRRAGVMLAVCHVLRYTAYTRALKGILDSGRIGEVVSLQHLEPVGHTHQAHSFVRGNWRNARLSSPMLLQKSCHDLDWISFIMGEPCQQLSSFGSLKHFRRAEQPAGAADRCLECAVAAHCPYDARRYYLGQLARGNTGWPVDIITDDPTEVGVLSALASGPYGRCVYACDNDVVDQQVVNMRFANDATASFTMTAFTRGRGRETRLFGTRGEIFGDSRHIHVYDFLTEEHEVIDTQVISDGGIGSGHGGGDFELMRAFVRALASGDPRHILSGSDASLESHLMVFAAEKARHDGVVSRMPGSGTDA